jgi:hypothetical protein
VIVIKIIPAPATHLKRSLQLIRLLPHGLLGHRVRPIGPTFGIGIFILRSSPVSVVALEISKEEDGPIEIPVWRTKLVTPTC